MIEASRFDLILLEILLLASLSSLHLVMADFRKTQECFPFQLQWFQSCRSGMGEHPSKKSLFLLNWGFVNPYLTHFVLERFLPKSVILKILSSKTKKFVQIPSSGRK